MHSLFLPGAEGSSPLLRGLRSSQKLPFFRVLYSLFKVRRLFSFLFVLTWLAEGVHLFQVEERTVSLLCWSLLTARASPPFPPEQGVCSTLEIFPTFARASFSPGAARPAVFFFPPYAQVPSCRLPFSTCNTSAHLFFRPRPVHPLA